MDEGTRFLPVTAETPIAPTLGVWEKYLEEEGRSPYTIRGFVSDLRLLATFLSPERPVGQIRLQDLEGFLEWLQYRRGVPCSPKSLARRITSIKAFFRWLHKYGVIEANPAERLVQRSVTTAPPRALFPREVYTVLETAQALWTGAEADPRPYTLFTLLYATGMKKGEVLGLRTKHLVLDGPQGPYLFVRYPKPSQRYKERRLALPHAWVPAFEAYRKRYAIVDRLFPWSPRNVEYVLENLGKAAGLERRLSFVVCRWTAALRDWRNGMEPEALREKLGLSPVQWKDVARKLALLDATVPKDEPYPELD